MTPNEFRDVRLALGLDRGEFARMLGLTGANANDHVHRMEEGKRPIRAAQVLLIDALLSGWRPGGWQPIDAAPIGRPLLGEDGPRIMLGWRGRDNIALGSYARGHVGIETPTWRDGYGGALIKPTHWRTLPQPPRA